MKNIKVTSLQEDLNQLGVNITPKQLNRLGTSRLGESLGDASITIGKDPVIKSSEYDGLDEEVSEFLDEIMSIKLEDARPEQLGSIADLMETIDYDALSEENQDYYNTVAELISEAFLEISEAKKRKSTGGVKVSYRSQGVGGRGTVKATVNRRTQSKNASAHEYKKFKMQNRASIMQKKKSSKLAINKKKRARHSATMSKRFASDLATNLEQVVNESIVNDTEGLQGEILERLQRITGILNWFVEDKEVETILDETWEVADNQLVEGITEDEFGVIITSLINAISTLCEEIEKN